MKIIYLHQYFVTPEMSGGTRSYEIARRLVDWGHEVHMITSDRNNNADRKVWKTTKEAGINVHWYPVPYSNKMSFSKRIKAFMKFARASALKASSLEANIVFATSTPLTIALPGIYTKWKKRIPLVFEVRDLWPELPVAMGALNNALLIKLAKLLERMAYKNSKQIVALSPGIKEGIVATGCPKKKVHIIPNSSDIDMFDVSKQKGQNLRKKYNWLKDRPLVVYTGTLGFINGVSYLAQIAAEVYQLNPDVRFLIVGDGVEYNKVKKEADSLEVLDKNFFMWDSVPKNEIPAVLSAADIATSFVIDLKVLWANSANKFFDALASGTPVAINYGGWQAELLEGKNAGLFMHPTDTKKAADSLVKRINDKEWLKNASRNAKRLAVEKFDRGKLTQRLMGVLTKATSH